MATTLILGKSIDTILKEHGIESEQLAEALKRQQGRRDVLTRVAAVDTVLDGVVQSLLDGTEPSYRTLRAVVCYWNVKTRKWIEHFQQDDGEAIKIQMEDAEKVAARIWDVSEEKSEVNENGDD